VPGGSPLRLQERDGAYVIRAGGHVLMSSQAHGSEEAMARAGLESARVSRAPRVLIGGLGLGYTLRATLDLLPAAGRVTVAELSPAVVQWNRGPLAHLSGRALEDARVAVHEGDLRALLRASAPGAFDVLLLDIDNGPSELTARGNGALYGERGIASCREVLSPGGRLVVWSAAPDAAYLRRLKLGGFEAQAREVRTRPGGPASHTLFISYRG